MTASETLRAAALAHLCEHTEVSIEDIRGAADLSSVTAQRNLASKVLKQMQAEGLVREVRREMRSPSPRTRYRTPIYARAVAS